MLQCCSSGVYTYSTKFFSFVDHVSVTGEFIFPFLK
jgi:hypothetical protein